MSRRRSTPWIHRWSRVLIGSIATLGAINTGYITATRLFDKETLCTTGCAQVLNSPYATVFGQPLALFGLLAYIAMAIFAFGPILINSEAQKSLRTDLEEKTWLLLFLGATAMMSFSAYLMYIMVTEFVIPHGSQAICLYCIGSAIFATAMFVLTVVGRAWKDVGQLLFSGLVAAIITLVGTLSIFAQVNAPAAAGGYNITDNAGKVFYSVTEDSGPAEIALAKHLKATNAKMYSVYWCSHCATQKKAFGIQALADLPYLECDAGGKNPQVEACQTGLGNAAKQFGDPKKVGYPTWEINGKYFSGQQPLPELAKLSGYKGPQNFKLTKQE
ncbi:vitamin K epoxide reductase family protein [Altericista sp. CCNU0014]|uniref:vitamin K epoxide reductase family protein n=1 Tax=Altericista sp. CCNU0014 TaxID=3082949 RepID=UPI00384D3B1F